MTNKLNARQLKFCEEYLVDLNAAQAAIRSGYTKNRADQIGYRLLRHVEIAKRIQQGQKKNAEKLEVSTEKVLIEMARIAFYRVPNLFNEDGGIKNIHDIDDSLAAAIHGIKMGHTFVKNADGEDELKTYIKSVKFQSKDKALESLAKHLGLFEKDNKQKGEVDQESRDQFMSELFAAISVANGRGLPEPRKKLPQKNTNFSKENQNEKTITS